MEASLLGEKKIITLSSADYAALSDAAKAMDVIYHIIDDTFDVNIDTSSLSNDNTHVPSSPLVKSALDDKQDKITASGVLQADGSGGVTAKAVDNTPTTSSTNLVTSGGVHAYATPVIGKGVNLLNNWYFLGGGSQQGGQQLPINTKGETSGIPENTETINRWEQHYDSSNFKGTWSLNANGYTMTPEHPSYTLFIQQKIRNAESLLGQKLTATVLLADGTMRTGTITRTSATDQSFFNYTTTIKTACKLTSLNNFRIGCFGNGVATTIVAAKLEVGDHQTLLRQENGVWVLNDSIPDYQYAYLTSVGVDTVPTSGSANVITSGAVKSAIEPATIYVGLDPQSFSDLATLSSALDTALASMNNYTVKHISCTASAIVSPFVNTYVYYGTLHKGSSNDYASAVLYPAGTSASAVLCRRSQANGWIYYPIVASDVDSTPTASSSNLVTSGGVKEALTYISLGSFSTLAELGTLLDTAITSMSSNSLQNVRVTASATVSPFQNTYVYEGVLNKSGTSTQYASAVLYPAGQANAVLCRRSQADGWTFMPIIAKDVDTTPTASSSNLITSGGVKEEFDRVVQKSFKVEKQQQIVITVSSYACAFRVFGILGTDDRIDLLFSYGRMYDGITGTLLEASLSGDYKTVTIKNKYTSSSGTGRVYMGIIFCPYADDQSMSVTVQAIPT